MVVKNSVHADTWNSFLRFLSRVAKPTGFYKAILTQQLMAKSLQQMLWTNYTNVFIPSCSPSSSSVALLVLFWSLLIPLDAGSLLCGHPRCRLAGQSIHGPKKLVCNAPCFSQSTQQSTMHSGRVVANRVLSCKKQARNGLQRGTENTVMTSAQIQFHVCQKQSDKVLLLIVVSKQTHWQ